MGKLNDAFSLVHRIKGATGRKKRTAIETLQLSAREVPDILISNELLEDMRKLADLYNYFKLTGAN
jgi:hypothetical protein